MTYMKLDDAIMIVLHDMAKGDCATEPSELLKRARSILGGHVDALIAIHAPPKHWSVEKAENLVRQSHYRPQHKIDAVAEALCAARAEGLNEACNIVDGLKRRGYGDKRAIDALDHAMKDISETARKLRRDAEQT